MTAAKTSQASSGTPAGARERRGSPTVTGSSLAGRPGGSAASSKGSKTKGKDSTDGSKGSGKGSTASGKGVSGKDKGYVGSLQCLCWRTRPPKAPLSGKMLAFLRDPAQEGRSPAARAEGRAPTEVAAGATARSSTAAEGRTQCLC